MATYWNILVSSEALEEVDLLVKSSGGSGHQQSV